MIGLGGRIIARLWRRSNDWLADHLAAMMATMGMFWVLVGLTWGSVILSRPKGAQGWDLFLVSIFFQGAALPVLGYISNKQGDRMVAMLKETHDATMQELAEIKALRAEVDDINEDTDAIRKQEGIGDGR